MLAAATPAAAQTTTCEMSASDKAWTATALAAWRNYRTSKLHLTSRDKPTIVLFDAHCRYIARIGSKVHWDATPHSGTIALPFGKSIPAAPTSATMSDDETGAYFFVMALPSVWIDAGVASQPGDSTFLVGVFLHEFMHVSQVPLLQADFQRAAELPKPKFELSDDALQDHWKTDASYVSIHLQERDLLFEAADEPDDAKARQLAKHALAIMDARQAHFFIGHDAYWRNYDDLFLTMEGVGQWLNYEWQRDPMGGNLAPLAAQEKTRGRGQRYWTQDEGLALFLVIDRFLPNWASQAFAPNPKLGIDMLREAVGGARGAS